MAAHEDLRRDEEIEIGSDRAFGIVFASVFLVVSLWPLLSGGAIRVWAAIASALTFAAATFCPSLLTYPNRLWTKFGILLGRIVSPVALGIIFYLVVTPTGLLMRLLGKDPLRLKSDPNGQSFWIPRDPPGPPPGSMTNQF